MCDGWRLADGLMVNLVASLVDGLAIDLVVGLAAVWMVMI